MYALDTSRTDEVYCLASKKSKAIVGVYSTSYAIVIGPKHNSVPIGMMGRVEVATDGFIPKGSLVGLSETQLGKAALYTDGYVLGIATQDTKDGLTRILIGGY